jgi:hypothetical protein
LLIVVWLVWLQWALMGHLTSGATIRIIFFIKNIYNRLLAQKITAYTSHRKTHLACTLPAPCPHPEKKEDYFGWQTNTTRIHCISQYSPIV